MKINFGIVLILLFQSLLAQSPKGNEFETIKGKVAELYINTPLKAKKDAYLLHELAKTNDEKIISYRYLGYIYDFSGNVDSARYFFQKQLQFSKQHFLNKESYYQAVIDYANWGTNYVDSNVLIEELTQALLKINEVEFPQQKGLMYMLMGDLLLRKNQLEKSNEYFDKSFNLIKGNRAELDYYLRKSEIALKKRDYLSAKENLLSGFALFNEKEMYEYPLYLNKLGYVYLLLGDIDNSNQCLYESLHYQKKNGFLNLFSSTYLNLSHLAKIEKNERLVKFNLDKALETNQGDVQVLKDIYLAYKDYYSNQGDFINENESLVQFNKINDSIFNVEKAKLGIDLESRFQLRENKKELALKEKIIQKEQKIKSLLVIGFGILLLLLIALIALYFNNIKTQEKLRNNQKLLHEEQLKSMLENQRTEIIKEKIKAKLEERSKLSLELHDGIANEIGALKVSLTNENALDATNINSIVDKIDKLYNEVRDLSHDLHSDKILDIEFSQLINSLCLIAEKKGIKTIKNVLINEKINTLEDSFLLNIYRILQEAINNVLKHANATEIQLDIIQSDTELFLIIKDNGVGFSKNSSKSGIGLKNIEKRIEMLKGKFNIISSEEGTTLDIKLPL
ncbi:tetratricopeptide repeat-containing sensor histidine kinase [Flavobacterium sp. HNIBRBA15423]|uniref:tetratricopeptide repeat-containing sensor histidine kinase n=1 Tax=Flavobacterium sp. HNIBRBA15423 TaxID=3458683 RepID=UPI004043B860